MSSLDHDPPIRLADRRRPGVDRRGDAHLLALVEEGDGEALDRLCERHAGTILAVARRVLWDRALAEEVTQQVLLMVWETPALFDSRRATVGVRLIEVTQRRAVGALSCRATQVRLTEAEERLMARWPGCSSLPAAMRSSGALEVADLPGVQRRVVELVYLAGLTHGEVALLLGVELDVVKRRLLLGVERLIANGSPPAPLRLAAAD